MFSLQPMSLSHLPIHLSRSLSCACVILPKVLSCKDFVPIKLLNLLMLLLLGAHYLVITAHSLVIDNEFTLSSWDNFEPIKSETFSFNNTYAKVNTLSKSKYKTFKHCKQHKRPRIVHFGSDKIWEGIRLLLWFLFWRRYSLFITIVISDKKFIIHSSILKFTHITRTNINANILFQYSQISKLPPQSSDHYHRHLHNHQPPHVKCDNC